MADHIGAFLEAEGGYVRASDLAAHTTTWVEPLRGDFQNYTMLVLPPNTQGIAQLQLFEMSKSFDMKEMGHNSASYLHTLIEMKKLAFADRDQWAADPEFSDIPLDRLLDPDYLTGRARQIDPDCRSLVTRAWCRNGHGGGAVAQRRRTTRVTRSFSPPWISGATR